MAANRKPNRTLISFRLNAGLSTNQLARLTGLSGPTVRLAERGHIPDPSTQLAIASYFELEPLEIWPLETQREFTRA